MGENPHGAGGVAKGISMNEKIEPNGHLPEGMSQNDVASVMLNNWIWAVLCTSVAGIRTALTAQNFHIGLLLVRISGLMGRVIGETLSMGDLAPILKIRSDCIKAFTDNLREIKIQPAPMPANAETALSRH